MLRLRHTLETLLKCKSLCRICRIYCYWCRKTHPISTIAAFDICDSYDSSLRYYANGRYCIGCANKSHLKLLGELLSVNCTLVELKQHNAVAAFAVIVVLIVP